MASLTSSESKDTEYINKTNNALTEIRTLLGLDPSHEITVSDLEPPTWNVELQCGINVRSGKKYNKQKLDIDDQQLLPCHFRLFPAQFMASEAPFTKDINGTLCRFLRARDYDVTAALEMYNGAIELREKLQAEDVLKTRDPNEKCWQNGTYKIVKSDVGAM